MYMEYRYKYNTVTDFFERNLVDLKRQPFKILLSEKLLLNKAYYMYPINIPFTLQLFSQIRWTEVISFTAVQADAVSWKKISVTFALLWAFIP